MHLLMRVTSRELICCLVAYHPLWGFQLEQYTRLNVPWSEFLPEVSANMADAVTMTLAIGNFIENDVEIVSDDLANPILSALSARLDITAIQTLIAIENQPLDDVYQHLAKRLNARFIRWTDEKFPPETTLMTDFDNQPCQLSRSFHVVCLRREDTFIHSFIIGLFAGSKNRR